MSDKAQPTPGPWHVGEHRGPYTAARRISTREGAPNGDIANVIHGLGSKQPRETLANARLIAAAPDMLAALRLYDVYVDTPQDRGGALGPKGQAFAAFEHAKRAAIAKATGA